MHGLGNDFVIVNQQHLPSSSDIQLLSKQIADRHIGIGCDQLIVYNKLSDYYQMSVYNHDGSIAKACGNAARCLAKLMYITSNEQKIVLEIAGRRLTAETVNSNEFKVNMGRVSFNENWMPAKEKIWEIAERYMIELKEIICADIGNPHLIIFSNLSSQDKKIVGEKLQETDLFPDSINVNFATIVDDKIHLEVLERGTGFTLACGSGACVTFAAAVTLGFVGRQAEVVFKYGSLKMDKEQEDIIMSGAAELVASGEFYYG